MVDTYVAGVVAAYWTVSITMVYLNKILLSNTDASIPAPLFVTWYQCVLTCAICVILGNMGEKTRAAGQSSILNDFPKIRFSPAVSISVLPLSLIFVGMITFNNVCLQYVEVSFCKFAMIIIHCLFVLLLLFVITRYRQCRKIVVDRV
jgi:GDP-fucose transporter C1